MYPPLPELLIQALPHFLGQVFYITLHLAAMFMQQDMDPVAGKN